MADACLADPPYGQTALSWDRWPTGWPAAVAAALPTVTSMWCFGSLRMFIDRASEFADWRLGEDVVWKKHNGSGASDARRHLRVHESVVRFYRGPYAEALRPLLREASSGIDKSTRRQAASSHHRRPDQTTTYVDDGLRLPAVGSRTTPPGGTIEATSVRGLGRNETEKPLGLVCELGYFRTERGSGTTGDAARQTGRRAVLIELREQQCEVAARRFDAGVLV